jgi:hypothetical protein
MLRPSRSCVCTFAHIDGTCLACTEPALCAQMWRLAAIGGMGGVAFFHTNSPLHTSAEARHEDTAVWERYQQSPSARASARQSREGMHLLSLGCRG